MKSIIVLILLVAIASSSLCEETTDNEPKLKLVEFYNDYLGEKDRKGEYRSPPGDAAERECMKEKIKLSVNSEKLLTEYAGTRLIEICLLICFKEGVDHIREMFEWSAEEFTEIEEDAATKISCIRSKIQELNGAENVVNEKCKTIDRFSKGLIKRIKNENFLTESLGIKECVNLDVNGFNTELLEAILKNFENSENNEADYTGPKNHVKNVIKILNKIVECFVDKLSE